MLVPDDAEQIHDRFHRRQVLRHLWFFLKARSRRVEGTGEGGADPRGGAVDDPYEVLGIEREAGPQQIRAAYLELARQFHPDLFTDASPDVRRAAHERMQQVNHAFAVLTNPGELARFGRQRRLAEKRCAGTERESSNGANFTTADHTTSDESETTTPGRHRWRADPLPEDLEVREFNGWGGAHWVYVHAPGGRAGTMNVTTGEVTIEREELREQVMRVLQHYAFNSWS